MTIDPKKGVKALGAYFKTITENTNLAKQILEKAERGQATPDELAMAQQYLKKIEEQSRMARMALDYSKKLREEKP